MAAVVLALHLTPGRRLEPTMEKYRELSSFNQGPDSFQGALLHLLQDCGSPNSMDDLARSIEAYKDDNSSVSDNVNKLLDKIIETLAWSDDFKLRDMAHRHELKFVMSIGDGGCYHKQPAVVKHQCIQLSVRVSKSSEEAVTVEQLKAGIDGLLKCPFTEEPCRRCNTGVKRTLSLSIQDGCDPDFLTFVCDVPINLRAADLIIPFSNSLYRVMAVVHWDIKTRKASVSREKEDGWWWHGVDRRQAQSFKYTAAQVAASRHFQDAAVLMAVRTSEEDQQETLESPVESDGIGQDVQMSKGFRDAAAEEDKMDVDADAEQDWMGQDVKTSELPRGAATAAQEENWHVDGHSVGINFHPPRTSTQRDENHGTGTEDASSGVGGKRPSLSEAEVAGNERGTQVRIQGYF